MMNDFFRIEINRVTNYHKGSFLLLTFPSQQQYESFLDKLRQISLKCSRNLRRMNAHNELNWLITFLEKYAIFDSNKIMVWFPEHDAGRLFVLMSSLSQILGNMISCL